jgi:L-2-hydroxyglutarate oxidase LhgO
MDTEVVVIGAGVVGIAIASKLAVEGYSTILLEKEAKFGTGISSRNTEVIHAGIYYQTDSLKGQLCLRGKHLLYEFCEKYHIDHKRTGKILLAVTQDEIPKIELTYKQAIANGLNDLVVLDKKQLKELEPELNGQMALLSPSSGILDTYGLMKTLLGIGQSHEMLFAGLSPVEDAEKIEGGWKLIIGGQEPTSITSRIVINSAGLHAITLSNKVFPKFKTPKLQPTKGCYLRYTGKSPISHIVYPAVIPGKIESRVDATPDLGNNLRFGPNIEEAESIEDFSLRAEMVNEFTPAIRRYLPNLDTSRLSLDTAGIRPKIHGSNDPVSDFYIEWVEDQEGWLNLFGMESPALTSSLSIAEYVYKCLQEMFYK